ncbi:MAG TPA: hypothetical protein VJH03_12145 [Blastocatellia bacterium]|nr:hypothetical protein [Blastocatellia bacterium]
MSRLDDELKLALAREEPPPGFAYRVLERVAAGEGARAGWWERLPLYARPPWVRWLALGATAALLAAIAVSQYDAPVVERAEPGQAQVNVGGEDSRKPDTAGEHQGAVVSTSPSTTNNGASIAPGSRRDDRARLEQRRKEQELRAEGEAARQQLILALRVASTTFNGAMREGVKAARIRPMLASRS